MLKVFVMLKVFCYAESFCYADYLHHTFSPCLKRYLFADQLDNFAKAGEKRSKHAGKQISQKKKKKKKATWPLFMWLIWSAT